MLGREAASLAVSARESGINFDDFPDSPYVSELRRGVSTRPFAPEIQAEYLNVHVERARLRARVWFSLSLLIGIGLTLLYAYDAGLHRLLDLGLAALLIMPAALMFGIVWTAWYQRLFLHAGPLIALLACGTIIVIAEELARGRAEATAGLAVDVFAVHFLAGMLLLPAVLADAAMLVVFLSTAWLIHMPPALGVMGVAVLLATAIVSAIVHRDMEISHRHNFLETALIRTMASRDGLTGLMNRRALDDHLRRIWQQGLRDKRQVALLLIDIDHFKAFNDRYGHQAGDSALRAVAHVIDSFARRPFDLAARYGGEEFAVVLYDVSATWVPTVCEQMRANIQKLHYQWKLSEDAVVTVSIGAGIVEPSLGRTIQGAIQFADEALYQAKQLGRNRVVLRGSDEYRTFRTGAFKSVLTR
jgi:diguanylate cyclase (GGDEF)-like protein